MPQSVGDDVNGTLADVQALARRVTDPAETAIRDDSRRFLLEVVELLSSLTSDPDIPVQTYAAAADLRDRVSSHLSAAGSLEEVGRSTTALAILARGVELVLQAPLLDAAPER